MKLRSQLISLQTKRLRLRFNCQRWSPEWIHTSYVSILASNVPDSTSRPRPVWTWMLLQAKFSLYSLVWQDQSKNRLATYSTWTVDTIVAPLWTSTLSLQSIWSLEASFIHNQGTLSRLSNLQFLTWHDSSAVKESSRHRYSHVLGLSFSVVSLKLQRQRLNYLQHHRASLFFLDPSSSKK